MECGQPVQRTLTDGSSIYERECLITCLFQIGIPLVTFPGQSASLTRTIATPVKTSETYSWNRFSHDSEITHSTISSNPRKQPFSSRSQEHRYMYGQVIRSISVEKWTVKTKNKFSLPYPSPKSHPSDLQSANLLSHL